MNNEDRARQFMPFDALKGLREELWIREQKALRRPRRELFEEEAAGISEVIASLSVGATVEIVYYEDGYDRFFCGKVEAIDLCFARFELSVDGKKRKIAFRDLYKIREI